MALETRGRDFCYADHEGQLYQYFVLSLFTRHKNPISQKNPTSFGYGTGLVTGDERGWLGEIVPFRQVMILDAAHSS